jgi:DNA (cytosine-5)-methyltransferase 1
MEPTFDMTQYKFIDLFAGCGGLSLGLSMAGLQGQFAVERDAMAFDTFSENFLGERKVPVSKFSWPSWLEKRAWAIDDLLSEHSDDLAKLNGSVQILAGGPPCQGFSFSGKRQEADPRNLLFEKYVQVVNAIKPSALILENVPGMKVAHFGPADYEGNRSKATESYYDKLKNSLEAIGYDVHGKIIDASGFGVPQKRLRLIVIGLRRNVSDNLYGGVERAFEILEEKRKEQLVEFRLPELISASDAISDLRTDWTIRQRCVDPFSPQGFQEAVYLGPKTIFQSLMHKHCRKDSMDSMRLARHGEEVKQRFKTILDECTPGVPVNQVSRAKFGLKKHRIYLMSASSPAPTITTLPDDVVHYAEPRILTVRESARLQSFPDWFRFRGKFTTGGAMRTKECPRYTQVGNAVPPLLARAIGLAIASTLLEAAQVDKKEKMKTDSLKELTAEIA